MSQDRAYRRVYSIFSPLFHFLLPLRVIGRENIPQGAAVICPNHSHFIDPVLVALAFEKKNVLRIMAKEEAMHMPVLGRLFASIGVFGVKRGAADVTAVKTALRCLKEGSKLLLFPEGTRVEEGEDAQAKTGAAMFAVRTGAPIVPVYIQPKKRLFRKNTVVIGQPYYPRTAGRKGTSEEYRAIADDLLQRIYRLKEEVA